MRLRPVHIISGGRFIDKILNPHDSLIILEISLFRGARQRKSDPAPLQFLSKLSHLWQSLPLRQKILAKDPLAIALQRLFDRILLPPRHKDRYQLITALANLPPHLFAVKGDIHLVESALPLLCVYPVAVLQRSVDGAKPGLDQRISNIAL